MLRRIGRAAVTRQFAGRLHGEDEPAVRLLLQEQPLPGACRRAASRACCCPTCRTRVRQANWSSDGKSIFFIAGMGVHSELFELNLASNKARQLTDGKHSIRSWSVELSARRHVLAFTDRINAGDVWLLPLDGSGACQSGDPCVRLSRSASSTCRRRNASQWKGADGVTVEGSALLSAGISAGQALSRSSCSRTEEWRPRMSSASAPGPITSRSLRPKATPS